jgi:hypothetical protein
MASAAQFRVEHLAQTPAGYRVRSVKRGSHVVRVGFPPGRRRKGSGKVLEILHPKAEKNASCIVSQRAKTNPAELLIFGNPASKLEAQKAARERAAKIRGARLNAGHKKNCPCFACKHQRQIGRANPRRRRADRRNPVTRKRARNQSETEQAVRLFESFHGRDAKSIVEKQVSAEIRRDYTALGNLLSLKVKTPIGQTATFDFDGDSVMLASSPNGKQLYCIGGRQNLLPLLDAESQQKDFIEVGECIEVAYLARKIHSNFEPVEWFHKFGEKTGVRPQLMFDKLKKQIFFVGGEYFIDSKNGVSPGIEN